MGKRFALVTTFYPPYHFGGDGVCVYRLAGALARRGHEVDVVHSVDAYHLAHPGEPEHDYPSPPGVTRHELRSARPGLASLSAHQTGGPAAYDARLRELLEDGGHDVIHFHNVSLTGGPGVLKLGRAPKLYTAHEYWLLCATHVLFRYGREACTERTCLRCTLRSGRPPQLWRYTGKVRRCVRHVDRFLMPSAFAAERHRAFGIDRPMTVLPHFVPDAPVGGWDPPGAGGAPGPDDAGPDAGATPDPTAAPTPGDPSADDRPYVLFVGRLEYLKGVQDLLVLFRDYREVRLLVAGDGDHRAALEAQAAGLDHVRFLGAVHADALDALYRGALAVVAPSICYEVFNLVPVEGFARGTPAVVRDLGATPELVATSGAGFTFQTLDACRDAIERLRTDADLRATLGARARAAYEEHWTEEVHMTRYLGIVDELLAAGAAS